MSKGAKKYLRGVRFWGFGKTVYQELLSVIADPDYGDITDAVSGRDVSVEFITAEESGASFPKTSIRVKPNQNPIVEDKAQLEGLLENQKDITELYQEKTYLGLLEGYPNSRMNKKIIERAKMPALTCHSSPMGKDEKQTQQVGTTAL